ncbi:MAG: ABC transporter permease, partial [Gemmatimonadota bacterium]
MTADATKTDQLAKTEATSAAGPPVHAEEVAPRPSRIRSLSDNKWFLRLIVYGALILAFQIIAMIQGPFFLPTIPDILAGIVELFTEGYILTLGPTLQHFVAGFLISMAIAIPLGALMGRFQIAADLIAPWVNTLYVTSMAALLPIIVLVFGLGFGYRVTVVVLFAVFFQVINTAAGVRYVDRELRETARAFATPPWRMFTRIYLPAAAPFLVSGIRMGLAMGIKGMVLAEIWVYIGIGKLLTTFTLSPRRLELYYALAVVIIGVAIAVNELLKLAEQRLRPYSR